MVALALTAVFGIGSPRAARGQDTVVDILQFLLTNRSVVTGDFDRDEAALLSASDAIASALLLEVATLPLSSSSGAFTYRFSPELGTSERASTNFGAFFVERAVTAGRGRATVGVTFRYSRFETLDGYDLRDGSLVVTANKFTDETAPFDQELLTLRLQTATGTAFLNVGVTDWLDVSAALPVVALKLDGERVDDFRGRRTVQASAAADVTGLADMALRTKVRLAGRRGSGLALGGEVRLPTGKREDLLGAGEATYRGLVIGSVERGGFAVSGNASYSTGGIADELGYGVNLTVAPAARFSFGFELFGRSVEGIGPVEPLTQPHPSIAGVDTIRLGQGTGNLMTTASVAGFKWNFGGAWLLNANVLVPLGDRGLQGSWSPSVSLEYAFGR